MRASWLAHLGVAVVASSVAVAACGASGNPAVLVTEAGVDGSSSEGPKDDGGGRTFVDDGGNDGSSGDSCIPTTCAQLGASCGSRFDGCGNGIDCGNCAAPETCGGGGTPSQCGRACTPKTCAQIGATCGAQGDGCGGVIQCGPCTAPQYCGGGGPNTCGPTVDAGSSDTGSSDAGAE